MTRTKKLTLCALLTALALALSYTERFIPLQLLIPLPGIKLGLANIVTLVTLFLLGTKSSFAVLLLRCTLGSLFGGGITGLIFSTTGGLFAVIAMVLAKKSSRFSVYGISIFGAAAHHIGQILAAIFLMQSVYVGAYLPYLLLVGIFTGFATAAATAGVLRLVPKEVQK